MAGPGFQPDTAPVTPSIAARRFRTRPPMESKSPAAFCQTVVHIEIDIYFTFRIIITCYKITFLICIFSFSGVYVTSIS